MNTTHSLKTTGKIETSKANMNCTGETNASKGVKTNYNDFHNSEIEGHILAGFMEKSGMSNFEGVYILVNMVMHLFENMIVLCYYI